MSKKDILVIGAGGFIGKALCHYLSHVKRLKVFGISRSAGRGHLVIDVLRDTALKNFLSLHKPQIIFHLAGGREGSAHEIMRDNVLTTISLLESIKAIKDYHPRVVIIGSAAEYGQEGKSQRPISESAFAKPATLYGRIKLLQIRTALDYSAWQVDVVVARLFNIIGPGVPATVAVGRFARCIVALEKQKHPKPFSAGNLKGIRDFLDIRDVCEALLLISVKGKKGEIYNVCSNRKIVMRDLLKQMIACSNNPNIKFKEDRQQEPGSLYSVGVYEKLMRLTAWKPQWDLQRSILDTLQSFR